MAYSMRPLPTTATRARPVSSTIWFQLDLTTIDPDEFMVATSYAAQGIMDQLVDCFERTIQPPQMQIDMNLTMS